MFHQQFIHKVSKRQRKHINLDTMNKQVISKPSAANAIILFSVLCLIALAMSAYKVNAASYIEQSETQTNTVKPTVTLTLIENPEVVARVLENLLRNILYSSSIDILANQNGVQKRGLDLGISRGFSGSQAGKHLMGLSAASFANGPGR